MSTDVKKALNKWSVLDPVGRVVKATDNGLCGYFSVLIGIKGNGVTQDLKAVQPYIDYLCRDVSPVITEDKRREEIKQNPAVAQTTVSDLATLCEGLSARVVFFEWIDSQEDAIRVSVKDCAAHEHTITIVFSSKCGLAGHFDAFELHVPFNNQGCRDAWFTYWKGVAESASGTGRFQIPLGLFNHRIATVKSQMQKNSEKNATDPISAATGSGGSTLTFTEVRPFVDDLTPVDVGKRENLRRFPAARVYHSATVQNIMQELLSRQLWGKKTQITRKMFLAKLNASYAERPTYIMGGAIRDALHGIQTPNDVDLHIGPNRDQLSKFCDSIDVPMEVIDEHIRIGGTDNFDGYSSFFKAIGDVESHDYLMNSLIYDTKEQVIIDRSGRAIDDVKNWRITIPVSLTDQQALTKWFKAKSTLRYFKFRLRGWKSDAETERIIVTEIERWSRIEPSDFARRFRETFAHLVSSQRSMKLKQIVVDALQRVLNLDAASANAKYESLWEQSMRTSSGGSGGSRTSGVTTVTTHSSTSLNYPYLQVDAKHVKSDAVDGEPVENSANYMAIWFLEYEIETRVNTKEASQAEQSISNFLTNAGWRRKEKWSSLPMTREQAGTDVQTLWRMLAARHGIKFRRLDCYVNRDDRGIVRKSALQLKVDPSEQLATANQGSKEGYKELVPVWAQTVRKHPVLYRGVSYQPWDVAYSTICQKRTEVSVQWYDSKNWNERLYDFGDNSLTVASLREHVTPNIVLRNMQCGVWVNGLVVRVDNRDIVSASNFQLRYTPYHLSPRLDSVHDILQLPRDLSAIICLYDGVYRRYIIDGIAMWSSDDLLLVSNQTALVSRDDGAYTPPQPSYGLQFLAPGSNW